MSGGQWTRLPRHQWELNQDDALARVHRVACRVLPIPERNEKLAKVMHMEPSLFSANNIQRLLTWPPLWDAFDNFSTVYIQEKWCSRTPEFRITATLVNRALGIQLVPEDHAGYAHDYTQDWAGSGPAAHDWTAEDHYTRHICSLLRCLERHGPPELEWVTSEPHENQVWILFHIMLYLHVVKKYQWWEVRRWHKSLWSSVTLQVPKKLSPYHYHNRLADLKYSRAVRLARRKLSRSYRPYTL